MVKHIVEVTVPATKASRELVIDVEIFSMSNQFPLGDVEGVLKAAVAALIDTLASDDPYRATVRDTAEAKAKTTLHMMQYGFYVPGKVNW